MEQTGEMYCPHCGTQVQTNRCSVCGTLVTTASEEVSGAPVLSGWWRRVGATLVDDILLFIPTYVVIMLVTAVAGLISGTIAGLLLQGLYMVKLLARPAGQTVGNRLVDTYVRDATTGHALTNQQVMRRWGFVAIYSLFGVTGSMLGTSIVGVIGLVDCLYPLFNARKQTLHDRFAGTIVLRK
ncbi:MAG: RDD family protein [Acidimicrobiales bacterium]